MKKIISVLLLTAMLFSQAWAFTPETEKCYFFGGQRYSVSGIDTDGSIFTGIIDGRLAACDDFESWDFVPDIDPVSFTVYLNGRLCAVGSGYTYVYDGTAWQKQQNNLEGEFHTDYMVKNGGSVVMYIYDKGTYQSFDGITWNKVENIPENLPMYKINNKIIFFSHGYMRGLYYSDTGESFTHHEFADFTQSGGNGIVTYHDGMYYIDDYRSESDEITRHFVMSSPDLENWTTYEVPMTDDSEPLGSSFVEINGVLHALSGNGDDRIFNGEKWVKGEYNMNTYDTEGDPMVTFPPFVYYNFSDFGIFAWSTDKQAYFIDNSGNFRHFDGRSRSISALSVKDGSFYAASSGNALWKSDDGMHWQKAGNTAPEDFSYLQLSGSNGNYTLTSEFVERGSRRFASENAEITAVIQYPGGETAKVAYEYAKDDYVTVMGGSGFFLLGGFDFSNTLYYSPDGITRGEKINFPGEGAVSNGKIMLSGTELISSADMAQLEGISAPGSILVKLNGEYLSFAAPPVVENGRTLIPIRFLFERAGAEVDWDPYGYTVTVTYGENTVKLAIDSDVAYVNGTEKKLDVPAQLINEKTMVPLRFISENLGFDVQYDEASNTAFIKSEF